MQGVVLFMPIQFLPVGALYLARSRMSAVGAWATLVLVVAAAVGGHVFILTSDSSTAAVGFLLFPFYIAAGVLAAYVLDALARSASGLRARRR